MASATVEVICYKSKVLKNGEHPLMIRITQSRKRKYISLGMSVNPIYWDFNKNKPKRNCPNKDEINQVISDSKRQYQEQILEYKVIGKDYTISSLVERTRSPIRAKTVKEVFELYISQLVSANRLRYANMYKATLSSMIAFNKHLDIYFSDIDISWLKKYEAWLRGRSLALNTLGTHFRLLRVVFNFAIEEKIVKSDYYPFDKFKVSKLSETTAKRSISKEEIICILNYKGKSFYECLAVDIFTFSYLTGGINFADIARLTTDNIMDGRLVYKRKKTSKLIKIPLQPKAVELLEKYKQDNSPYLLPILSSSHQTEQQKINRIHKVYGHVNKHLKNIGKELNIPLELTTYVARHSYATVLKRAGVAISIISESLGHSSEKVTQIYLDSFENNQIDEAMKNLL